MLLKKLEALLDMYTGTSVEAPLASGVTSSHNYNQQCLFDCNCNCGDCNCNCDCYYGEECMSEDCGCNDD